MNNTKHLIAGTAVAIALQLSPFSFNYVSYALFFSSVI